MAVKEGTELDLRSKLWKPHSPLTALVVDLKAVEREGESAADKAIREFVNDPEVRELINQHKYVKKVVAADKIKRKEVATNGYERGKGS